MNNQEFKDQFKKRLIKFSLETIKLCQEIRKNRNFYPIADQLIRSATSIGANVVEAKGSSSKKDFARFFEIAYKSSNETQYWLFLIKETSNNTQIDHLLNECQEIAKMLCSSILTMKGKKNYQL